MIERIRTFAALISNSNASLFGVKYLFVIKNTLPICTFYFPPCVDGSKFSDQLDMLGDKLDVDQHRIHIHGDFNILEINWNLEHPVMSAHTASFKVSALFHLLTFSDLL